MFAYIYICKGIVRDNSMNVIYYAPNYYTGENLNLDDMGYLGSPALIH